MPISENYSGSVALLDVEELEEREKARLVKVAWRAWLADRGWTEEHVTLAGFEIMLKPQRWDRVSDLDAQAFYRGFLAGRCAAEL